MNELIIPKRGDAVSADEVVAVEHAIAERLFEFSKIDELLDMRGRARALEQYLRDKEMQGPMLGAQRRLEGRIGQLLGEPKVGPAQSSVVTEVSSKDDRADFRILAHALNGKCNLTDDEWRKSRRALISLMRNRLGLVPPLPVLPAGIFRCIVADPPWKQDTGPGFGYGKSGHDHVGYEQMSVEHIKEMAVRDHAADDAHLYLWTINKYVEHAYEIARAWGFKPSVLLVWAKKPLGSGLGDAFRLSTEFVLYARRGSLKENCIVETTWFNWPRGRHSEKPAEFYELVESVTPAPYAEKDRLEVFARKEREGWTVWGDEVDAD